MTEVQVWVLISVFGAIMLGVTTLSTSMIWTATHHSLQAVSDSMRALGDRMDARFDAMETRMEHLDAEVAAIAKRVWDDRRPRD